MSSLLLLACVQFNKKNQHVICYFLFLTYARVTRLDLNNSQYHQLTKHDARTPLLLLGVCFREQDNLGSTNTITLSLEMVTSSSTARFFTP